jgi:titin
MATYSKGTGWSDFVTVATVSSTATSYVKTGLSANHIYQFRVRANNTVGSSGYVGGTSTWTYMTPAAPSGVSSSINSAGTQITTDWDDNAYVSGVISFSVERSVNGGAYASVVTGIVQGTTSWTDTTPGAGTNTYRVKAVSSTGSLSSAFATGNTVTTVVPPLAPTNLSPNGLNVDLENTAVVLTWKHNPGADNAKQSSFYIDYSTNGGTTWTALNGAGTTSTVYSYTIAAGTLTNGVNYLWRVRTRGSTLAAIGPNSASASFTGSATPTVTIDLPIDVTHLPLVVTWAYAQDQGSPQSQWEAQLLTAGATRLIEAHTATNATESVTFTSSELEDGVSYVVRVRAKSAAGLWSAFDVENITIDLPVPAAITATPEYQPATGSTVIHLEALAPVGAEITATTAIVERRVPGSDQWVKLIDGVTLPTDVVDPLPATRGTTEYRATSVSTAPSYRVNAVVSVTPDDPYLPGANPEIQWVFLNYGDAFEKLLRFRSNPKTSESTSRAKATRALLGRSKPVLLLGEATQREVAAEGNLHHDPTGLVTDYLFDSPPAEWSAAALEAEVVCYRDFTGRRVFASLDDVGADDVQPGLGTVSLKVTEVDYTEQYGVEPD